MKDSPNGHVLYIYLCNGFLLNACFYGAFGRPVSHLNDEKFVVHQPLLPKNLGWNSPPPVLVEYMCVKEAVPFHQN